MPKCVSIRVVSFNLGIPQTMLESERRWNHHHVFKVRDALGILGHAAANDFVFCSEVGDMRKGFQAANVDFQHIVREALPGSSCSTTGAYLSVWNVKTQSAAVVQSNIWSATPPHAADMYWQAFDLTYRDAPPLADRDASQLADRDALQLAAPKVGLLVGNMHIPVGRASAPTKATRRRIVEQALQHLARLEVDAWRGRTNFPVMRVLVGDCNLDKEEAEAVMQQVGSPPLTALQRDFDIHQWQVCDVQFPRHVLKSARNQYTNHIPKITLAKIPP